MFGTQVYAMFFSRINFALAVSGTLFAVAACDNPLALPAAVDQSFIDTLTLSALRGTPITAPSGYNITLRLPARTDRGTEAFDFAFDIDPDGTPLIFTTGALGLAASSAIQMSNKTFADIRIAPLDNYERDSSLVVGLDSIFIVRSTPTTLGCIIFIGALPRYGKFRVLTIDANARQITLEALVNVNCGFRGLEPGLPTQ